MGTENCNCNCNWNCKYHPLGGVAALPPSGNLSVFSLNSFFFPQNFLINFQRIFAASQSKQKNASLPSHLCFLAFIYFYIRLLRSLLCFVYATCSWINFWFVFDVFREINLRFHTTFAKGGDANGSLQLHLAGKVEEVGGDVECLQLAYTCSNPVGYIFLKDQKP